jgi:hypothetical protein
VSGVAGVNVSASDNVGVSKVELYVNGSLYASYGSAPYNFSWDTTRYANGSCTLTAKAYDAAGNAGQSVGVTLNVANSASTPSTPPQGSYSLWSSGTVTGVTNGADSSVELGVKFTSDVAGYITGIRFYKSSSNTGTHTGTLWSSTGTKLATATFSSETASGWQQVTFSSPVAIAAKTTYVASYHCNNGYFSVDRTYFSTKGADAPPLHAPVSAGVYAYGSSSIFPKTTYSGSNYWVDVVFTPSTTTGGSSDTMAPTVSIGSPASGATVVGTASVSVSAGDNVGVSKVELYANGTLVGTDTASPYTFSWDTTRSANGSCTLTAKAYDAAGNVGQSAGVTVNVSNSATSPPVQTTYSIWSATSVPVVASAGADSSVELGIKFKSDAAGYITGIRFYKSSGNTGTHTGTLWSSTGKKLASATFANETASGWQQVNFAAPVAITANTTYVASYHCTKGYYSDDQYVLASKGVDNPPLHALVNGGVYAYGTSVLFPKQVWNGSNYWVDVVFKK